MPSMKPNEARSIAGRKRRPMSLAWRLTVMYAAGSSALLLVAAGLMYYQLIASLRHENLAFLGEEVREFRSDFVQPLATPAMIRRQVESDSPSTGDAFPTFHRVFDATGNLLAQTPGLPDGLAVSLFPKVPADGVSQSKWPIVRVGPEKSHFQIGSAAVTGLGDSQYVVQVALDLTEEDKVLSQYRNGVIFIIAPALLAAALGSYLLARSGLKPLRQVVQAVRRVESTTLDQRLDPAGFPGELARLAGSFNDMLGRIEDAFVRLARFSADIAHELRTPLGCIRGEMEVALRKARSGEEYREVLGSCLEECLRLSSLIDRLLFLARSESDETMIRVEVLDLARELKNVSEFYEPSAAEHGIALSVDAAPGLQARLDRTLLQSALGNLLENAIAHTPLGGKVKLSGSRDNGTVRLEVRDTGCGIEADHLPFVLDRFYRVQAARGRQGGHVGLGLAIVKSIAVLHGGTVEIESQAGAGTVVRLVLPSAA